MTSFTAGQTLTAANLNAAFALYLPIGGVSSFSQTLLAASSGAAWMTALGFPTATPGAANGLATLNASAQLTASQLPSSTGPVSSTGSVTSAPASSAAAFVLNSPGTTYSATISYQFAGVTKWTEGMVASSTDPYWGLYNSGLSAYGLTIDWITNAAAFGGNLTFNGTLTGAGSGVQTISLTETGDGTVSLANSAGAAVLANSFATGAMNFNVTTGATFTWNINGSPIATLSAAGLSVGAAIKSTVGGFTFPDSTTQTTAATTAQVSNVRQTVLAGDNTAGAPSFLTTGSGLTPAFTASTPLVISFANGYGAGGSADSISVLSTGAPTALVPASSLTYLYAVYGTATTATWGYNLATPQWGPQYNQLAQLSLQLNNTSLDDFGSTWTNTSVTFNNTSPHVTGAYYGVFSGTATMKNANFNTLFPAATNAFTLRAWAKATSLASINTIFGGATNGTYGPLIMGVNSSGKSLLYLSSAAASWDIASATTGSATITTGTWHYYELTFDPVAGKYYYYVDGVLDQTVNSSVKAAASMAAGGGLQVGLWNTIDGWTGNIAGVEYLPYCLHPAGTTYTVPTTLGTIGNSPVCDWFDTVNMVMKTPSAASASAGVNPTFTTSKRVYVGEVTAGASSISSVTPYAFAGYYDSGWTVGLPTYSTAVNKNSNLGTADQIGELVLECTASDVGGYVPGDRLTNPSPTNGSGNFGVGFTYTRNTITLSTGSGGTNEWWVAPKAGGALVGLTLANWKWKFIIKRSN